jgi:hypothetical protein
LAAVAILVEVGTSGVSVGSGVSVTVGVAVGNESATTLAAPADTSEFAVEFAAASLDSAAANSA